jgi:hypothetical protein
MTAGTDKIGAFDKDTVNGGASESGRFLQALNPCLRLAKMEHHISKPISIHILEVSPAMLRWGSVRTKADAQGVYPRGVESVGRENGYGNHPPRIEIDSIVGIPWSDIDLDRLPLKLDFDRDGS